MDRYCRICMRTNAMEMISLYCELKGEVIANMMIDCADVTVAHDDNLPGNVCLECLQRLEEFFMFRNMIRKSDASLREIARNPTKQTSTPNTTRTISYPTEDQIESLEVFDTFQVIRLKGLRCCGCDLIFASKSQQTEHSLQQHFQEVATNSGDSVVFQCSRCYESFPNRIKLLNHTKSYESNEIYHCTICNVLFDIKYRLQQHQNMSKAHRKQSEVMTVEYLEETPSVVLLEKKRPQSRKRVTRTLTYPDERFILCIDDTPEYEIIHMGGERCCGCDLSFMTFQELQEHCNQTHSRKNVNALHECDLCYENFELAQSLNRHKTARVQKEVYYCKFCDLVIDVKYRFEQHLKSNVTHQTAVRKAGIEPTFTMEDKSPSDARSLESLIEVLEVEGVRCCGCNFVCTSRAELENHSEQKHSLARVVDKDENMFECNICFKRFTKSGLLTYHKNLSFQKTVYKCKRCDLQSAIKHRMLQHVGSSAHQGADLEEKLEMRQFSCCFVRCTFTSEDPNDLLDHVEDNHTSKRKENAEERESENFVCSVCHKCFRNEKSLQLHQFPRRNDGKHCCTECGASFLYLSSLNAHEKIHSGVREFQCDLCDRAFFDERTLRIHKVCHNEERPFVCDVCSKSFLRKGNLKNFISGSQTLPCREYLGMCTLQV
ncbi:zinc finger protein 808-like isoform X2 [Toxorhynchites rutilus septentrionalis]|uniref:zinc finger protein 808-like isoform X2 n=1 Tax=Toxorhynchites rutilus septentrionalis TaxID=329112 RepID=UPI00247A9614|nr:zinc finger protein 808-like isoform X2 [Toxorhynchites rutilus septentrionalis]